MLYLPPNQQRQSTEGSHAQQINEEMNERHTRACFSEQMTANCRSDVTSTLLAVVGDVPPLMLLDDSCPVPTYANWFINHFHINNYMTGEGKPATTLPSEV